MKFKSLLCCILIVGPAATYPYSKSRDHHHFIEQFHEGTSADDLHRPQPGNSYWYQNIANAFRTFENQASQYARRLEKSVNNAFVQIKNEIPGIVQKFRVLVSNLSVTIGRGVECVVQEVVKAFDKAEASEVIQRLEKSLESGNEYVTDFFNVVGNKVTEWRQQNNRDNINTGEIFTQNSAQNAAREDLSAIFQDRDVIPHLEKMVEQGIMTVQEVQQLQKPQEETDIIDSPVFNDEIEEVTDYELPIATIHQTAPLPPQDYIPPVTTYQTTTPPPQEYISPVTTYQTASPPPQEYIQPVTTYQTASSPPQDYIPLVTTYQTASPPPQDYIPPVTTYQSAPSPPQDYILPVATYQPAPPPQDYTLSETHVDRSQVDKPNVDQNHVVDKPNVHQNHVADISEVDEPHAGQPYVEEPQVNGPQVDEIHVDQTRDQPSVDIDESPAQGQQNIHAYDEIDTSYPGSNDLNSDIIISQTVQNNGENVHRGFDGKVISFPQMYMDPNRPNYW